MSLRLRDLIKAVRAAKTAAHERSIIQTESAIIRTEFSKGLSDNRQRNIAKLLYMSTLGYRTKWGQMECVKLIASHNYLDKRIGYLSINLLLDENQEVIMLATHQIKTDIMHSHRFISALAMTTLANVGSEQICADCAPEIEQLLTKEGLPAYLKKKAILCALKIVRKVPAISDQFNSSFRHLLESTDHGVLLATISLMIEFCHLSDFDYKTQFQEKYVGTLIRILKSVTKAGYTPEYDVGNISDPFLQIKILKLLRILGIDSAPVSEKLGVVLASIVNTTDTLRNVGSAILYECVTTIMNIKSDGDLRAIAVNTLGKFLSNKDNNIRYVALATLCQVVETDLEAVQKDRGKIVDCLKDPDRSIRRRALHLVYSLVDAFNVRNLVRELIAVLGKADVEFRSELTAKLCYVSEKFSPNPRWLVDTLLRVMSLSGEYVPDSVVNSLTATISRNEDLHSYSAQKLYLALNADMSQESLNQVAVWTIGEYGDLLVNQRVDETSENVTGKDIVNVLSKLRNGINTGISTKQLLLTALFKLSDRLGADSEDAIREIIDSFRNDINMELQQRACEYSSLLATDAQKRHIIVERLPPLPALAVAANENGQGTGLDLADDQLDQPETKPAQPQNNGGIVDLLGGLPSSNKPATTTATNNSNGGLGSLFGSMPSGGATNAPVDNNNVLGSFFGQPSSGGGNVLGGGGVMDLFGQTPINTGAPLGGNLGMPLMGGPMLMGGPALGNPMASPMGGNPMVPMNLMGSPMMAPMNMMGAPMNMMGAVPMTTASPLVPTPLGGFNLGITATPTGTATTASPLGDWFGAPMK